MKLRNKKTGEIYDKVNIHVSPWKIGTRGWTSLDYSSVDKFNEEWEDCESKEPYIKDEKIRKAVRAWAEVNSIEEVLYAERTDRSLWCLTDMGEYDCAIEFVGWIPTLKDGADYTIAELCGEEE